MAAIIVVNEQHKSLWLAIALTVAFGPIGLFYATTWGGLVMTIFAPLMLLLIALLGIAWENELIMGMSVGAGISFFIADWAISIIWAITSVNAYNRKAKQDRQHQNFLMDNFEEKGIPRDQRVDQLPFQGNLPPGESLHGVKYKPELQQWLKANPGRTINDYYIEFGV